jgi:hypothetical protein
VLASYCSVTRRAASAKCADRRPGSGRRRPERSAAQGGAYTSPQDKVLYPHPGYNLRANRTLQEARRQVGVNVLELQMPPPRHFSTVHFSAWLASAFSFEAEACRRTLGASVAERSSRGRRNLVHPDNGSSHPPRTRTRVSQARSRGARAGSQRSLSQLADDGAAVSHGGLWSGGVRRTTTVAARVAGALRRCSMCVSIMRPCETRSRLRWPSMSRVCVARAAY